MKAWKTIRQDVVFDASPYLKVLKQRVELPNGALIEDFYQVELRHFVVVVPLLPDGKIITITQYKHGLGRSSLTFPAGFVEENEKPEAAAARELLEETGFKVGQLVHLGEFVDNGNQRGCVGNYYVAKDCVQISQPNSGDLEEMEVVALEEREIDRALEHGGIGIIHHASVWALAKLRGLMPTYYQSN
ncbi:MAG: NUDIX hydrolase [Pseudomonadota bacterium]